MSSAGFFTLYKVFLTYQSVEKSSRVSIQMGSTVYYAIQGGSNFSFCEQNLFVLNSTRVFTGSQL